MGGVAIHPAPIADQTSHPRGQILDGWALPTPIAERPVGEAHLTKSDSQ